MSNLVKISVSLPVAYLVAWLLGYTFVMDSDFRYVVEYFKLGWTFSGGEYPSIIWLMSAGLFVASLFVAFVAAFFYRRFKQGRNHEARRSM